MSGTRERGLATAGGKLRVDGRSADQMRTLKMTPDFISTAEGRPFSGSEMQDLLALAAAGIRRLTDEQRAVLPVKFSARAR